MPHRTDHEVGAEILKSAAGPQPQDAFSQDAAGNKRPPHGIGLTEKTDVERSEGDKSDFRDSAAGTPKADAKGQTEKRHAGGSNDGITSANPRVLSGDNTGDATFHKRESD